jgi:hypothetical protein
MVRMAQHEDQSDWQSSTRGEQAWKEARELIASRNAAARKVGKSQRQAYERRREEMRRAAAVRRHERIVNRRTP